MVTDTRPLDTPKLAHRYTYYQHESMRSLFELSWIFMSFSLLVTTKSKAKNLISCRYPLLHPPAGKQLSKATIVPIMRAFARQPPTLFPPRTPSSSEICSSPGQLEFSASAVDLTASQGLSLFILITYSRLFPPCSVCLFD